MVWCRVSLGNISRLRQLACLAVMMSKMLHWLIKSRVRTGVDGIGLGVLWGTFPGCVGWLV